MRKKEKENLKLADGRIVLDGPYIYVDDEAREKDGFKIGIEVKSEFGKERIELVQVFDPVGDITLPQIQVSEKDLWTKNLLAKVIEVIKQDGKGGETLDYIIAQVIGEIKPKRLILPNGDELVGNLDHLFDYCIGLKVELPTAYWDLFIRGNIKDSETGEIDVRILFTVKNLYTLDYPGTEISPYYEKNNEDIWCKMLEQLVIDYLNLLVTQLRVCTTSRQIAEIAQQLTDKSEWGRIVRQLTQKLLKIGPDDREDERIKQAFALIEQVYGAGK